jgi:TctA family transporter
MEGFAIEFFIWFIVVLIIFWIINSYIGLKRFASTIIAFLIASIIVFVAYQGDLMSEVFITATLIILALFGLSAAIRSVRSDFVAPCVKREDILLTPEQMLPKKEMPIVPSSNASVAATEEMEYV